VIDWNAEIAGYLNLGANPDVSLGKKLATLGVAVASAIEVSIGAPIDQSSYTEAYDGNGKKVLFLRHAPIVLLVSASVNGTALTVEGIDDIPTYPPTQVIVPGFEPAERYRIELTDYTCFSSGLRNVIVSYVAGWQRAPGLVAAVAKWAAQIWRDRDRLGIQSQSFAGQSTTFTRAMPDDVKMLLAPYRPAILPPL
jgi:hypothetical protein